MNKDTTEAVKAALEFYADEKGYDEYENSGVIPICCEGGDIARDALELIEREGDEITDPAALVAAFRDTV